MDEVADQEFNAVIVILALRLPQSPRLPRADNKRNSD